jgi:hypothetical protein
MRSTLVCETAAPFVERNTTFIVPLGPNGLPESCAADPHQQQWHVQS